MTCPFGVPWMPPTSGNAALLLSGSRARSLLSGPRSERLGLRLRRRGGLRLRLRRGLRLRRRGGLRLRLRRGLRALRGGGGLRLRLSLLELEEEEELDGILGTVLAKI